MAETKEKVEERKVNKVKCDKVKKGDLHAFIYWGKVLSTGGTHVNVKGLDGIGDFSVNGRELIEGSSSADQYHEEEKVSKTRCAELLTTSFNRMLTVCFDKQDGTERVLRGRLIQPEPLLGRSHVEDLDVEDKNKLRLVDHRTLKYLIVDGVRYSVK